MSIDLSILPPGALTRSSREIAELTDKLHKHVLEDIGKKLADPWKAAAGFSATACDQGAGDAGFVQATRHDQSTEGTIRRRKGRPHAFGRDRRATAGRCLCNDDGERHAAIDRVIAERHYRLRQRRLWQASMETHRRANTLAPQRGVRLSAGMLKHSRTPRSALGQPAGFKHRLPIMTRFSNSTFIATSLHRFVLASFRREID